MNYLRQLIVALFNGIVSFLLMVVTGVIIGSIGGVLATCIAVDKNNDFSNLISNNVYVGAGGVGILGAFFGFIMGIVIFLITLEDIEQRGREQAKLKKENK